MSSKKVSVLTVSRRTGWERDALISLKKQTYDNIEWVVVTEGMNRSEYLQGDDVVLLQAPEQTQPSNLNASLNEGLRFCSGEYVVFYQDFIELDPDCIEKLVDIIDSTDKTFVTTCTKNPSGRNEDPRYLGVDVARPCRPEEWEANVAIASMEAMYELGGFDEEYDKGWSWDNVNLAERAEMLGYNFILDETNRPQLKPHDKPVMEPNGEFHSWNMRQVSQGKKPIKLDYLIK